MGIKVPTAHNEAKKGDIAKTVIMPGDPLRAKYIADNFLEEVVCYNNVRNMLGYTGKYKGVRISVQGSGMGIPSMGIYSKELFEGYEVDNIIRIGSAGCLFNEEASEIANSVKLRDILVAKTVDTDSNYLVTNNIEDTYFPEASVELLDILENVSKKEKIDIKVGEIFTSDVFYNLKQNLIDLSKKDVLGVEMETLALYANAKVANKNALAIFTVSDNAITGEGIPSEERETGLNKMIKLALELAYECEK
jgi:purine-nucleoside phosphorylase